MADVLEFYDLQQEFRGAMNPGRLKLQQASMVFRNLKTGKIDQYASSDLERAHWISRSRGPCLKILLKSGTTHRFDGFKESDFDRLSDYLLSNYETKLEKKELSTKGWNWGIPKFNGNTMDFRIDGHTAFEIPLQNVSHSMTSKNEVTMEFHQNDEQPVALTEMRFFIPSDAAADFDPVAEFHKNVMTQADIMQVTGDAITILTQVQCLTPRGRYEIKIYPTFLQLHGQTFDYKIPYTTILRLFLLPHRDQRQYFFMVSIDPPIKQGQTRYHFLILLFNSEDEITQELNLNDEDMEKFENKLQREMAGAEHEIISRIMKVLVNKKITVPGTFLGHTRTHSIACSHKAATGFLYPLERGFVFVHKPPLHIRFDEISFVNFGRSAGSTRYFDFDVETIAGPVFNFVGIEKDEYGELFDFVKQKKLRVKNVDTDSSMKKTYVDNMEDSDNEDPVDKAHIVYVKREARSRQGDDDDDDESDISFKPDASASEPDDEYDSNPESTSDSNESTTQKEKKKKKKEASEDEDIADVNSGASDVEAPKVVAKAKEKKPKENKESSKPSKPRKKKERDVNQPKRPQSAYFLWLGENRGKIKTEFPGISITDLSKKAGEQWKEIKEKSKWEALAVKEKKNYDVLMAEYRKGEKSSETTSNTKATKKPKAKETSSASNVKSKEYIEESDASDKPDDESGNDDKSDVDKKTRKDKKMTKGSSASEAEISTPPSSGKESNEDSD